MASFLRTRRSPNHPTQCTTYSLQQQQSFHSIQTIHGDKNTGSWQQTACIEFYLYGMFPSLNVPIILSLPKKRWKTFDSLFGKPALNSRICTRSSESCNLSLFPNMKLAHLVRHKSF